MDEVNKARQAFQNKRESARAGEIWSINDINTQGHKSEIVKRKGDIVKHIPRTHSPTTRGQKNIKLQENPQPSDKNTCYMLPKVQTSKMKCLGKKHNEPMKNPIDKSIKRHIKHKDKRK